MLERSAAQPAGDAEPVEEAGRAVAPTARDGCGGGRPADTGLRDRHPGEGVEQLRLAAAGRAGDGDDGVLPGEPAPRGGLVQDAARLGQGCAVEPGPGEAHQFAQRVQARPQVPVVGERHQGGRGGGGPARQDGELLGPGVLVHPPCDQPVAPDFLPAPAPVAGSGRTASRTADRTADRGLGAFRAAMRTGEVVRPARVGAVADALAPAFTLTPPTPGVPGVRDIRGGALPADALTEGRLLGEALLTPTVPAVSALSAIPTAPVIPAVLTVPGGPAVPAVSAAPVISWAALVASALRAPSLPVALLFLRVPLFPVIPASPAVSTASTAPTVPVVTVAPTAPFIRVIPVAPAVLFSPVVPAVFAVPAAPVVPVVPGARIAGTVRPRRLLGRVLGGVLVSDGGHRSPLLLQYGQRGDELCLWLGVHFETVERRQPALALDVHDPVDVFLEQPPAPVAQPQRAVGADPLGEPFPGDAPAPATQQHGGDQAGHHPGVRGQVPVQLAHLVLGVLLQLPPPAPYGHPDALLGALRRGDVVREFGAPAAGSCRQASSTLSSAAVTAHSSRALRLSTSESRSSSGEQSRGRPASASARPRRARRPPATAPVRARAHCRRRSRRRR